MKRYAMVIELKREKIDDYKRLHRVVWPEVLDILRQHKVSNYSIFLKDNLLFGYLEYHGDDYAMDMKKVAASEVTQRWWKLTEPCQQPLATRSQDEWWAQMEEVFHMD